MKTETKVLSGFLIAIAALLLGGVFFLSKNNPNAQVTSDGTVYQIDYSKGYKIGSDSAKVKVVEFSDFECPACKEAEPAIKNVISSNGDNVQFIYRHFPLPQHLNGKIAAAFAEAAGEQGKFWEAHDKLFETQNEWSNLSDPTDFYLIIAKELNLDEEKIKKVLSANQYSEKIQADINEGNSLGVNSTPTFYVNGKKATLTSFSDLQTAVEAALSL